MSRFTPPFHFDLAALLKQARRFPIQVDGVSISLPFVSFSVKPNDVERKIAREIIVRLANKRVLNAFECCDNCIEQALASLQEIRSLLVDKQVELVEYSDGSLYLLLEIMLEGIRQFFTFEEQLHFTIPNQRRTRLRTNEQRQAYFAALEMLRAHLHQSLTQVTKIAAVNLPRMSEHLRYNAWQIEAYDVPKLSEGENSN
jgi:hypothetical protein